LVVFCFIGTSRRILNSSVCEDPAVSASTLKSSINRDSPDFQKNTRRIIELLTEIKNQDEQIRQAAARKPSRPSTKGPAHCSRNASPNSSIPARISLNWALSRPFEMLRRVGRRALGWNHHRPRPDLRALFMVIANDAR